jgi:hypothetical protein
MFCVECIYHSMIRDLFGIIDSRRLDEGVVTQVSDYGCREIVKHIEPRSVATIAWTILLFFSGTQNRVFVSTVSEGRDLFWGHAAKSSKNDIARPHRYFRTVCA